MAIAPSVLLADSTPTDATSYVTASVAVAGHPNELITLGVMSVAGTNDPNIPTLTTARGLNIAQITSVLVAGLGRLSLFRTCISSGGTTGTLTIDFAGQTQTKCGWHLVSWTGTAATAANNGSDGVAHGSSAASSSNATSITRSMATPASDSADYYVVSHGIAEGTTPSTGFTELSDVLGSGGPAQSLEAAWIAAAVTSIAPTWATSVGAGPRMIAATEILLGAAAGGQTNFLGTIPI